MALSASRVFSKLASLPKQNVSMKMFVRSSGGHHDQIVHLEPDKAKYAYDEGPYIILDQCPGREHLGFGMNSEKIYYDLTDFPFPPVRYRRETPEIMLLRQKEKGDWRKLTLEEKKQLYRASFRYTFAEMDARTGWWKSWLGWSLFWHGVGLWWFMFVYWMVNRHGKRESLSLESRTAQLQRMIALRVNAIDGIGSKWDYEKDEWKQ